MTDLTPRSVRRVSWPLLLLTMAGVAALTLLPIGWQLNRFVVWLYYRGLQLWRFPLLRDISMDALGGLLNVLLMVPIAVTAALALPKVKWWQLTGAILLLSSSVESAQALLPLGREGSLWDVATNTAGGAAGAGLATWIRRRWAHSGQTAAVPAGCPPPAE